MSDLEKLIEQDKLRGEAFEARMKSHSYREAGWTSIFIGLPLAAAGGFTAKATMEMVGTADRLSDVKEYSLVALSGLAWAAAGMIGARKNMGVSPIDFVRSWRQKREADALDSMSDENWPN